MPGIAIVGAQWGDEGKGKIVDFLAPEAEYVVRYQGGANAGHTVNAKGKTFKLNLLPSGVLHEGATSILGDGMVIDPEKFIEERRNLMEGGLNPRLKISDRAHIVLPHHKYVDGRKDFVGTTGKGIGPAYADRARRVGIRFGDLLDEGVLRERIERLLEAKPNSTRDAGWATVEDGLKSLAPIREQLAPFIADTGSELRQAIKDGRKVLFEGAQATLLDLNYGTYPFVTSSHPTVGGILVGTGVNHKALHRVYGVAKAFNTRVGHGPFATEVHDEAGILRLRGDGSQPWDEYGTTTGRPRRVGWLDLELLKYAVDVNGLDGLVINKMDILGGLDEIPVCTGYDEGGQPVFKKMKGWSSTDGVTSRATLPKEAQAYLDLIEDTVQCPVVIFSAGPEREKTYGEVHWG
ncbi:adenylosuccinate synthase [Deinococcus radiodurans]|jgi:Adenylosuccinate synthetase (EC 6.3.4.4)|uniref:Adenylosuccinate synthetase n=1 Tax=Deinococcus radiodurans (strain ATCC 13939 / DSM 20539 / JCM 16871 / CCUG 27074 / LMG 4051 / NBRC 15346 / NCIMB 9279 / VKM B-1422 / R1) TaxID=243230 RepID=PURA_DEIRA|nr:adenylosuccinate synthase [Deinococcus radiodurans]Q9RYB5.1 RecName: Full=Adenylosuccinate synthetase; Short=AMPSase; Short=AdSS; AltName: Full=IMP--aspartate ligase [Deinococcus radiodurans R1 = ATCC 13939 = DSM 20539]AAF09627.1 adenylosuccinate synthase [Deinococcus radiodurans R1 = ATCC 13939 = DSM 20539]ANC70319.1 adenylosuccinate synthase [Deinococcus radiodurans R1 = ATCC 13939 = DSM 20539]QEM72018.1 adenylosuccinate synthetase [Deinococcus radiodurans]QIP28288.1 adenylosuccinate synt